MKYIIEVLKVNYNLVKTITIDFFEVMLVVAFGFALCGEFQIASNMIITEVIASGVAFIGLLYLEDSIEAKPHNEHHETNGEPNN